MTLKNKMIQLVGFTICALLLGVTGNFLHTAFADQGIGVQNRDTCVATIPSMNPDDSVKIACFTPGALTDISQPVSIVSGGSGHAITDVGVGADDLVITVKNVSSKIFGITSLTFKIVQPNPIWN